MSYCRVGNDSDVYVIAEGRIAFACMGGLDSVHASEIVRLTTRTEMMWHLVLHRDSGDKVPQRALQRLVDEFVEGGENASVYGR